MSELLVRVVPVPPKAITVAEFNRRAKATLEERYPSVWIEGEIASCKIAPSGHAYFDLKDEAEEARLSCCLFKGNMLRARAKIRDGERVQVRGRASLYAARGSFQFIVDAVLPSGAGSAAAALEALKRRLADEGLMAPDRKRGLPRFPQTLGVVTSAGGAAFADICRVLHRRWPVRIVLAPTLVQGGDAPTGIVKALLAIQRVRGLDVVIIGRGGGASDDLGAFNDERVARAIAACSVPVVSAVGHEVDHTLADLVADLRASTPSQAAELCVPEWRAVQEDLSATRGRLERAARARLDARRVQLGRWEKRLGDPQRLTSETSQRLDDALARLGLAVRRQLGAVRRQIDDTAVRLHRQHPQARLARDEGALKALHQRLAPALRRLHETRSRALREGQARLAPAVTRSTVASRSALGTIAARLDALSPLAILARGYAVALVDGHAVTRATTLATGTAVTVRVHEGEFDATVTATRKPS